jgi:hypothetical protein
MVFSQAGVYALHCVPDTKVRRPCPNFDRDWWSGVIAFARLAGYAL